MGYLVCQNCKGYYKLQPGENPEDFTNKCTCGGNLRYAVNIDVVDTERIAVSKKATEKTTNKKNEFKGIDLPLNRKMILISGVLMVIFGSAVSLWFGLLGVLVLLFGFFLFFTDSWILYLLIFAVWTFGGILAFLFSTFGWNTLLLGFTIVMIGILNLWEMSDLRKKKIRGHLKKN